MKTLKSIIQEEYEDRMTRRGNPIAQNRYRWQTYTKDTDEPMESEWEQFKADAIAHAKSYLIKEFKRFKKDDMVIKVYNEMNYKETPIIITLDDALKSNCYAKRGGSCELDLKTGKCECEK